MKKASVRMKSGGISFVELLIGMTLMAILMALCARLFTSSWQRYHVINIIQEVKLSGIRGIERFSRDFNETSMTYIFSKENAQGLITYIYFPSRRQVNGTFDESGAPSPSVWKTWILYYLIAEKSVSPGSAGETYDRKPLYCLVRKVKDLVPKGGTDISLDADAEVIPELSTLRPVKVDPATGVTRAGEVCARGVTFFGMEQESNGAQDTYRAVLETWGGYLGKPCSAKAERVYLLRNL
ncbi:MAG: hypothetical protein RDV48_09890 [Candidatus Eremiobacteraeota bacterium]|nr:hypothetical protein [Candidatus Eremiobacteraeota bacterium]